jgi:uncharacterized protein YgiM (DUF1202 family)
MRGRLWILLGALILCSGAALAQTQLWVTSGGAKLKAARKATAPTVARVPIGAELTVLEAEGKWYRVATGAGEEGWIYRGKVSESPPAQETEGGGGLFSSVASSRIEATSADSSRSIRGLSPETEQYAKKAGTEQKYRDALDQVLELQVREAEVERFLQRGRVGEYAD